MAKSRNIPPCCCVGYRSIQPAPWLVVRGSGCVGLLAPLNDGYVLPYLADSVGDNKCIYQCPSVPPFTAIASYMTGVASGAPFRRTQYTLIYTGGFLVVRAEIPTSGSEHCRGIRGTTPVVFAGAVPFGSSIGTILYTGMFRTLDAALTWSPSAGQGCVPVL